jgi:hypothetical protein
MEAQQGKTICVKIIQNYRFAANFVPQFLVSLELSFSICKSEAMKRSFLQGFSIEFPKTGLPFSDTKVVSCIHIPESLYSKTTEDWRCG